MLQQELLLTLAEISVTIAALSAASAVFSQHKSSVVLAGLLRDVAIIGMLVALFAVLPLVFWDDNTLLVFKLCALAAIITWLGGYGRYLRNVRKDRSQITSTFWIGMIISLLGLGLFALCAFSDDLAISIRMYQLALLAWLAIAGLNFVASVFSDSAPTK